MFVGEAPFGTGRPSSFSQPSEPSLPVLPHFILIPVLLTTGQLPVAHIFWGSASEFLTLLPCCWELLPFCGHGPSAGRACG